MATPDPNSTLPPWATEVLFWIIGGLIGLLQVISGWIFISMHRRIDKVEKSMENTIPGLVSRLELIATLQQMREDAEKRDSQTREDRRNMHVDNQSAIQNLRNDISAMRENDIGGLREDLRAVHGRIDEVLNNK